MSGQFSVIYVLATPWKQSTPDAVLPGSLAGGRLPKFHLVSLWIDDPAKLSVLGIVDLLENVAAFFA
jgi:hypothetical protein